MKTLIDALAVNEMGEVRVDGSSTVFPIIEAVAEEYTKVHKTLPVHVAMMNEFVTIAFHFHLHSITDVTRLQLYRQNTWVDNITVDELRL
ncbi:phosphate ABC transporter substrate-binding protein, partial [Bacillus sp. D-CC]